MSERTIAGQFCGQCQPHGPHAWQTPTPYGTTAIHVAHQCAGTTGLPVGAHATPAEGGGDRG